MQDLFNLIPYPEKLTRREGSFSLTAQTVLVADAQAAPAAENLRGTIEREIGLQLRPVDSAGSNCIDLQIRPSAAGEESYALTIEPGRITLAAPSLRGLFYATQTLMQIALQHPQGALPCLAIEDRPRFSWRGLMLDEGRHFHGMAQVKRLLDLMARLKLNVFHWHLTEDQGWRIEIPRYPRLVEVGSKRAGSAYGLLRRAHNRIPHEGYYSQAEIREVIAYAAERNIAIVPEIDIPGHSRAALAAYPQYSCTGGPFSVGTNWGIFLDVYCPGKEATFEFLQNIFDEIMALFPGDVVHIGGDEVFPFRWQNCPDCRRRAREEGIGAGRLQTYFSNRMAAFLQERGKRPIGWSEILQPGLAESAMVQYWLPQPKKILQALRQGRDVIMSPMKDVYLDYSYNYTSLERIYNFEPVLAGLEAAEAARVRGIEAPLWSEYVWNPARLDYQLFPRLLACAETGWTPGERKNYADFEARLDGLLPWLDANRVAYAPRCDWNPPKWKQRLARFMIDDPRNRTAGGPIPFPG